MVKHVERNFAGRTLRLEAGRLAKQAAGSCLLQFGETVVLAAVTVSDNVSTLPFFPLTVEYREKAYAAGKIPGGFLKREGRPQDEEILAARVIDRSVRPLFPEGFKNEVQVFVYVLSADQENDADVLGLTAASAALTMSQVPWNGPIAAVRVGRVEGAWILNPTFQQLEFSDVDMVVSGSKDSIVMVEGGALELTEAEIVKGLEVAHKGIRELLDAANELVADMRQPKMEWTKVEPPAELVARVKQLAEARVSEALNLPEKSERAQALAALKATIQEELGPEFPENAKDVANVIEDIEYHTMRNQVLTHGERVDGRDLDTVRPISCEVGTLPRTHGSALFTRGQTQALVPVTLGTTRDEQRIDSIDVAQETAQSFMLHYNFPPFSTGEVKPLRGPSRREVVRAAHHHHSDPTRQDRRPDRPQGQDHPGHPGADRRRNQRGRHRPGHDFRGGRRRRAGARHGPGAGAGARGGQNLRGRREEHHGVRRLHRDPAGRGGPAPHLRAAAWPDRAHRGRGEEGRPRAREAARGGRAGADAALPQGADGQAGGGTGAPALMETVRPDPEASPTTAPRGAIVVPQRGPRDRPVGVRG